jgi:PTH1 family peptidyl-tRNA hydrolase
MSKDNTIGSSSALILVGLGNPGPEYADTRHNIGFMLLDQLAQQHQLTWKHDKALETHWCKCTLFHRTLYLLKPQTYMNLSGRAVEKFRRYYHLERVPVWMIYDDVALALGQIRFRLKGSSGGQKGAASLMATLPEKEALPRLRLGVGAPMVPPQSVSGDNFRIENLPPLPKIPLKTYVLQPFNESERKLLYAVLTVSLDALHCAIEHGVETAMNLYNGLSINA